MLNKETRLKLTLLVKLKNNSKIFHSHIFDQKINLSTHKCEICGYTTSHTGSWNVFLSSKECQKLYLHFCSHLEEINNLIPFI